MRSWLKDSAPPVVSGITVLTSSDRCQRWFLSGKDTVVVLLCHMKRSALDESTNETRTGLLQWRWTRIAVSLSTSMPAPRILPSSLCCDVTVTGLRAQAILLSESEAVVHGPTVTSVSPPMSCRSLEYEQVVIGAEPVTFEATRGRKRPTRAILLLAFHCRHRSLLRKRRRCSWAHGYNQNRPRHCPGAVVLAIDHAPSRDSVVENAVSDSSHASSLLSWSSPRYDRQ